MPYLPFQSALVPRLVEPRRTDGPWCPVGTVSECDGSVPLLGAGSGPSSYSTGTVLIGPRQANLVLIAYGSSEGSGEPAHPRSLARNSAARSYKLWVKRNLQTESQIPAPLNGWACAVKIWHDGMLEDTNSLDGAQLHCIGGISNITNKFV